MRIECITQLHGHRPFFSGRDFILTTRGRGIFRWRAPDNQIERICNLPNSIVDFFIRKHRLTRRIFRYGVRCGVKINEDQFLVADSHGIYCLNIAGGNINLELSLKERFRPLGFTLISNISGFKDGIYFGDYGNNPERGPMHIWHRTNEGHWESVFKFNDHEIDHIHSIIPDPIRNCVWVLTGDLDRAASIWLAKGGFYDLKPVIQGAQFARSCIAFPINDGLLYATDSHLESNSIRLLKQSGDGWISSIIEEIPGSCIYGTKIRDLLIFSTTYEPGSPTGNFLCDLFDRGHGPGILGDYCEMIGGNLEIGFHTILHRPVDNYPKRLFQFSTFIFPTSEIDTSLLAVYNAGLKNWDDCTEVFRLT